MSKDNANRTMIYGHGRRALSFLISIDRNFKSSNEPSPRIQHKVLKYKTKLTARYH